MKKLLIICSIVSLTSYVHSQGLVNFLNSNGTAVRTNASAIGGGTGNIASSTVAPSGYIFAVLTAPSTVTSVSLSLQELLTPPWSFTGLYGTNIAFAPGGRISGGVGATVNNWAPGVFQSFIIVGWSASLGGEDWSLIASELDGASFNSGTWFGANFINEGYIGASAVGTAEAGGGPEGLPAFALFGTTSSAQGTPIMAPFDLYANVPEPTTSALLAIGLLALWRNRRNRRA